MPPIFANHDMSCDSVQQPSAKKLKLTIPSKLGLATSNEGLGVPTPEQTGSSCSDTESERIPAGLRLTDLPPALSRANVFSQLTSPSPASSSAIKHSFRAFHSALPRSVFTDAGSDCSETSCVSEAFALEDLDPKPADDGFVYVTLTNFTIYRSPLNTYHANEMITLDRLHTTANTELRFDGMLHCGDSKAQYRVQSVPFKVHTVAGYGDVEVESELHCIQSVRATARNIWYNLDKPSLEYRRYHEPFLWYARLTKYVVDFLLAHIPVEGDKPAITLRHFQTEFFKWLESNVIDAPPGDHDLALSFKSSFKNWWTQGGQTVDFRSAIAAAHGYIWRECYNIDDKASKLCKHPFWNEILPNQLTAIRMQPNKVFKTIVTPYVFHCFRTLYFFDQLEERVATSADVESAMTMRKRNMGLPLTYNPQGAKVQAIPLDCNESYTGVIEAGDVVCIKPDDQQTAWKKASSIWLAYVQKVREDASGEQLLDVLWLYEPQDTTIGDAFYPYQNERFLSDNCSCSRHAVHASNVIGKVSIQFTKNGVFDPNTLFVRQRFRTVHEQDTNDFVTLKEIDFRCSCDQAQPIFIEIQAKYSIGSTVLVRLKEQLYPAQILAFLTTLTESGKTSGRVQIRRFRFKRSTNSTGIADWKIRPNELVATSEDEVIDIACDRVVRKCHIRFFEKSLAEKGDIVTPYDRDGCGDFFYIVGAPAPDGFPPIEQGWDPRSSSSQRKMTGLGLFCGGGNLDHGLEEGGAVRFKYAVDWDMHALHSYRANSHPTRRMHFFLGSVNDYLARALAGDNRDEIAMPGGIDFISAGSPCPGFSALQNFKMSDSSRRNASMVASVVAFIDLYSPRMFVLENVVTMTSGMGKTVFSQIIAALVGLGYQVQQFLVDSWSHGSPQQRSRLFIVATAPHEEPLVAPAHSHGHPPNTVCRTLGTSANGMPFGIRRDEYTVYPHHMTPDQSCADLPDISDAQVQLCPRFPDHRTPADMTMKNRARMLSVATWPPGASLMQMYRQGRLSGDVARFVESVGPVRQLDRSTMYSRVHGNGLFPTMVTRMTVADGINGRIMHWQQPRILTVMEARRAQGYLDEEVLIGTPTEQMRIVGNSVDRKVALILGLAIRDSWLFASQRKQLAQAIHVPSRG